MKEKAEIVLIQGANELGISLKKEEIDKFNKYLN